MCVFFNHKKIYYIFLSIEFYKDNSFNTIYREQLSCTYCWTNIIKVNAWRIYWIRGTNYHFCLWGIHKSNISFNVSYFKINYEKFNSIFKNNHLSVCSWLQFHGKNVSIHIGMFIPNSINVGISPLVHTIRWYKRIVHDRTL